MKPLSDFERADLLRAKARHKEAKARRLFEDVRIRENDSVYHTGPMASWNGYMTEEKRTKAILLSAQADRLFMKATMLDGEHVDRDGEAHGEEEE